MNDEEKDVMDEFEEVIEPVVEEVVEPEESEKPEITTPPKSARRKSRRTKKKSSGVSVEKAGVKPVDEAKAEPAVVTPPASMSRTGDRIRVQSLWPSRLIIRGTPSGEEYVWPNSGAIEAVNPVDVGYLMSKNRGTTPSDGRGCCGGDGTRIYFQLV